MRGISGSGKSTKARELGQNGIILSTDDFFKINGKYKYDQDRIGQAHLWNQARAKKAMEQGVSPIVIDNTNVIAKDAKPYAEEALKYGYKIKIAEPDTPWKFDAEELTKRNNHGVPKEVIEEMLEKWQPDEIFMNILNN